MRRIVANCYSSKSSRSITTVESHLSEKQQSFLKQFRQRLAKEDDVSLKSLQLPRVERGRERLPPWLTAKRADELPNVTAMRWRLRAKGLSTVCEEAKCPNLNECWGSQSGVTTATVMMMGDTCTRACRFCSVKTSRTPPPLDPEEPRKVAEAIREMNLEYVVVTMVDRDDVEDGGASHVAETMRQLRLKAPKTLLEVLAGDFQGKLHSVERVAKSGVHCYAHNIECVERLSPRIRDRRAGYRQSLNLLEAARTAGEAALSHSVMDDAASQQHPRRFLTKSSIMLGLGETEMEVRQALCDLRSAGVDAVTIGQYLQPSPTRMKVQRYVHPDEFDLWEQEATSLGFLYCASGPMVRSSYKAAEFYLRNILRSNQQE